MELIGVQSVFGFSLSLKPIAVIVSIERVTNRMRTILLLSIKMLSNGIDQSFSGIVGLLDQRC